MAFKTPIVLDGNTFTTLGANDVVSGTDTKLIFDKYTESFIQLNAVGTGSQNFLVSVEFAKPPQASSSTELVFESMVHITPNTIGRLSVGIDGTVIYESGSITSGATDIYAGIRTRLTRSQDNISYYAITEIITPSSAISPKSAVVLFATSGTIGTFRVSASATLGTFNGNRLTVKRYTANI